MNWSRMALKTPVLLKVQVPPREQLPGQLTGPVTASANRMEFSTSGDRPATPAPPYVDRLQHWIFAFYD